MSTTFGIQVPSLDIGGDVEMVEVAFRSSTIRWKNELAQLLPDETPVEPLDNSAQGIYTIGDIKKEIILQKIKPCEICGKMMKYNKFANDVICEDFLNKSHTKNKYK